MFLAISAHRNTIAALLTDGVQEIVDYNTTSIVVPILFKDVQRIQKLESESNQQLLQLLLLAE